MKHLYEFDIVVMRFVKWAMFVLLVKLLRSEQQELKQSSQITLIPKQESDTYGQDPQVTTPSELRALVNDPVYASMLGSSESESYSPLDLHFRQEPVYDKAIQSRAQPAGYAEVQDSIERHSVQYSSASPQPAAQSPVIYAVAGRHHDDDDQRRSTEDHDEIGLERPQKADFVRGLSSEQLDISHHDLCAGEVRSSSEEEPCMPGLRRPQTNLLDDGQYLEITADSQHASPRPLSTSPLYGESRAQSNNTRAEDSVSPALSSRFARFLCLSVLLDCFVDHCSYLSVAALSACRTRPLQPVWTR